MSQKLQCTYDDKYFFTNQKCFIITGKNLKYLSALINSELEFWYLKKIGATLSSSGYEMSKIFMQNLPIPTITPQNKETVNKIEKFS